MTGGLHLSRISLSLSHSLSLFRGQKEFSHLGEIRSIIPLNVHVMALTATATLSTRHYIMDTLSMKTENTHIVYVSPEKDNIVYYVADKPSGGIPEAFGPIAKRVKQDHNIGRIIIFCRTYEAVTSIYSYLANIIQTERISKLCEVQSGGYVHTLYSYICKDKNSAVFHITITSTNYYRNHCIWFGSKLPRCSTNHTLGYPRRL